MPETSAGSMRRRSCRLIAALLPGGLPLGACGVLAALSALATPLAAMPPAACAAPPLPYPEAVAFGRRAATAVLAGKGAETCLRGKLTRALLNLSDSCAASGQSGPLCALADKAVVVTPMSRPFMNDTAHQILALSDTPAAAPSP